jgi:hypothetical protein
VTEPVADSARGAAQRLAGELSEPRLVTDVEAALVAGEGRTVPDRYLDPISLGALIVSVAQLAWTVYTDLKKQTPEPAREVVERRVRVQLPAGEVPAAQRDRIIEVVVEETVR